MVAGPPVRKCAYGWAPGMVSASVEKSEYRGLSATSRMRRETPVEMTEFGWEAVNL
jgi:hypothetical protein